LAALLPTAKRERPEREITVLLFSSVICFSRPLCSVLLFFYLLVAVAATGTADGGWETRWQLL
jgi:hypothetical protein